MNKCIACILLISTVMIVSCKENSQPPTLQFATSTEYSPFEYQEQGELKGFEIELAKLVAKELGKKPVFKNMQFSIILPALASNQADVGIATFTITPDRKQLFDFSKTYPIATMAAVFKKNVATNSTAQLAEKKLAVQLGSTMQLWLKHHYPQAKVIAMDHSNESIEALKAGDVEVILMDGPQAARVSQMNPDLAYKIIAKSEDGYGIALKKNSPLTAEINRALRTLKDNGTLETLQKKWLGDIK